MTNKDHVDLNSVQWLVGTYYLGSVAALTVVILPGLVGAIAQSLQLSDRHGSHRRLFLQW